MSSSYRPRVLAALAAFSLVALGLVVIPAASASAATLTVTSSSDGTGAGTLRAAVAAAGNGDTINFSGVTEIDMASAINLSLGVTIDGGGVVTLGRVNAASSFSQFSIANLVAGHNYTFTGLTFTGAALSSGSAIFSDESGARTNDLTLDHVNFHDETTSTTGGAALWSEFTDGNVSITNSTFTDDSETGAGSGGAVHLNHTGGTTTISASTFTGNSVLNSGVGEGGAVYAGDNTGPINVTGSTFDSNSGQAGGAFFADDDSALNVSGNSIFKENTSSNAGAGLYINSVNVSTISGTTFHHNVTSGNRGGGVFTEGGGTSLSVTGSTFDDNTSGVNGGAFGSLGLAATTTFTNSTFTNNATNGNGGAIGIEGPLDATLKVVSSTLSGNSSDGSGGAFWVGSENAGDVIDIDSSTFSANVANSGSGLGSSVRVDTVGGAVTVLNSTADDAAAGGDFAVSFGTVSTASAGASVAITQSTIVGPGDVHVDTFPAGAGAGDVTIADSILLALGGGASIDVTSSAANFGTVRYSILSDATVDPAFATGPGNQLGVADAGLGALANNGGPTQTMLPAAGSPAINAGDPAIAAAPGSFDQRGSGFARVVTRLDIGAVEVQAVLLPATGVDVPLALPVGAASLALLGLLMLLLVRRRIRLIESAPRR